MLEAELEPEEAITNYLLQKIEVSRTQPESITSICFRSDSGAPHIQEILKGPLKKLENAKPKSLPCGKNKANLSKQIDPELLILTFGPLPKLCRLCHTNLNGHR